MKRRRFILAAICIVIAVMAASSCTPTDPGAATNPAKRLDETTITALQSQISADPRMAGSQITVSGNRDQVVLSGTVLSGEQRDTAEQLTRSFDPQLKIENKLRIDASAPTNPETPGY